MASGVSQPTTNQSSFDMDILSNYHNLENYRSAASVTPRVSHRSPIRPFFCCGSELSLSSIVELHEYKQNSSSASSSAEEACPHFGTNLTSPDDLEGGKNAEGHLSCQQCSHSCNVDIEPATGERHCGEGAADSTAPKSKHKKLWPMKLRSKVPKTSYMDYRLSLKDPQQRYHDCSVQGATCVNFDACEHHVLLTHSQPSSTSSFLRSPSNKSSPSAARSSKGRHHRKRQKKNIAGAAFQQHQHAPSSRQLKEVSDSVQGSSNRNRSIQPDVSREPIEHSLNRSALMACHNLCAVSSPSTSGDQFCSTFKRNCSVQGASDAFKPFSFKFIDEDEFENSQIMEYTSFNNPECTFQRIHSRVEFTHCLVPELQQIANCSFYWGIMDRYEAEKLLENKAEGTFLLRDSAQEDFLFSVSFRRYGRSLHARIEQWNHKFSFDSHDPGVYAARTVCRLIEHYKDPSCCMFFEPMLTLPLNRTFPFSLQHLCRAAICSITTYDKLTCLPLPASLKDFLRYYHYKLKVNEKRF